MNNRNDPNQSLEESHKQRRDFDEDANDLWFLYGKEAKSRDEAWMETLRGDMDGVLIFVCAMCFQLYLDLRRTHSRPVYSLLFSLRSSC